MTKFETKTAAHLLEEKTPMGVYTGVSDHQYQIAPGTRRSDMVKLLKSPQYYKHKMDNPDDPSDALTFGVALHTLLLQPNTFSDHHAVGPSVGKRTKKWQDFKIACGDKTPVHPDDLRVLDQMVANIRAHKVASRFINDAWVEVSAWAEIESSCGRPVYCKARADAMNPEKGYLVDVKTTRDATPRAFQRSAWDYRYDIQDAFYTDIFNAAFKGQGVEFNRFVVIAIDKTPPYDLQVYVADPEFTARGRETYRSCLTRLIECETRNEWPGYPEEILNLTLPSWA